MKCTIFTILLLVGVFNWNKMPICIIWKKYPQKMHKHLNHHREDSTELRIEHHGHVYKPTSGSLLTSVDLWPFWCILFNVFLNLRDIIFPTRGRSTIFAKIDYMPIFCAGPLGTSDMWHLKTCHKKVISATVSFFHKDHFWEMHKENEAFL